MNQEQIPNEKAENDALSPEAVEKLKEYLEDEEVKILLEQNMEEAVEVLDTIEKMDEANSRGIKDFIVGSLSGVGAGMLFARGVFESETTPERVGSILLILVALYQSLEKGMAFSEEKKIITNFRNQINEKISQWKAKMTASNPEPASE